MSAQSAVLIVDDDPALRRALTEGLSDGGYDVVTAASAEDALDRLAVVSVDLALIDLKLPRMSGIDLAQELRQRSPTMVLIPMSASPTVESAIAALRLEAYDYLLKPFTLESVLEAVQGGLKRQRQRAQREMLLRQLERSLSGLQALQLFGSTEEQPVEVAVPPTPLNPAQLSCGALKIDLQRHVAHVDDQELDLTPTEFNLLVTLADRAPAVVSPQELLRQSTGYQADPAEARELVKWHIHHLRRKVESDTRNPRYIINVRGVGYRLAAN